MAAYRNALPAGIRQSVRVQLCRDIYPYIGIAQ